MKSLPWYRVDELKKLMLHIACDQDLDHVPVKHRSDLFHTELTYLALPCRTVAVYFLS